jgi:hypothetical protein
VQPRLASNWRSSYLLLPSAASVGVSGPQQAETQSSVEIQSSTRLSYIPSHSQQEGILLTIGQRTVWTMSVKPDRQLLLSNQEKLLRAGVPNMQLVMSWQPY